MITTLRNGACCSVASFTTLGSERLFGKTPRCHWSAPCSFGGARDRAAYRVYMIMWRRARAKTVWTVFSWIPVARVADSGPADGAGQIDFPSPSRPPPPLAADAAVTVRATADADTVAEPPRPPKFPSISSRSHR